MPTQHPERQPFDVLVVDDDRDIRDLLGEYFRGRGFEVDIAADGPAALAMIRQAPTRYGLVVTDLQMPGADGLAVLKAAREGNASAYVVIITGFASLDSAIQAVRLGAYDYLTKPFSLGQIDVTVRRILDRLALDSENRQLTRQVIERGSTEAVPAVAVRLDSIEARLVRFETLLRELVDRRETGRR